MTIIDGIREFAVQGGNDLANSLGSTGRGRNNVGANRASTTPVLHGGTINGLLCGSRGVDGGHQALNDAKLIVNDLCKGRQAVGRAGRVGDLSRSDSVRPEHMGLRNTYHSVFGVIRFKVNATDKHRSIGRWRRDDNLLSATLQMG